MTTSETVGAARRVMGRVGDPRWLLFLLLGLGALPVAAQPSDLELTCTPEHALLDQREVRPDDVRQHWQPTTYYLFDNPQLFELRVSLINDGPERLPVATVAGDWPRALQVRLRRDSIELRADELDVEPTTRLRRALVYFKDGEPITDPRFGRRITSPGAQPLMAYDDSRWEEQAVDALPRELGPYEEAVVILRLRAPNGGELPLGLYRVSVTDQANHVQCERELLVVMRSPRSPLDVVDAHVVRANALQAEGELDAAADELKRATESAPEVLKGWVYRSALALARNDLDGQAEAATRLEALLKAKSPTQSEEFIGIVRDARAVAQEAPELRRRVAAANGVTP